MKRFWDADELANHGTGCMGVVVGEIAGNRDQIFAICGFKHTVAEVRQTIIKKQPITARHIWVLKHRF